MLFGTKTSPASPASPPSLPSNATQPPAFSSTPARTGAVLSSGVSIKGDVKFGSQLLIDGEVEGNITSNGALIVGSHGTVVGDIQAGSITIQGSVDGNVLATERCALEAGANLHGDIESPRLAVNENASFIGSATITA